MAADPALSLPRVQEAARAFLALVSDPASLPEFEHLQVGRRAVRECRVPSLVHRSSPPAAAPTAVGTTACFRVHAPAARSCV